MRNVRGRVESERMNMELEAAQTELQQNADAFDAGVSVECQVGRETLRISTGVMAKQSHGAVFVTYRDSAVLVTATMAKPWRNPWVIALCSTAMHTGPTEI